jgi:hypothetical protein
MAQLKISPAPSIIKKPGSSTRETSESDRKKKYWEEQEAMHRKIAKDEEAWAKLKKTR